MSDRDSAFDALLREVARTPTMVAIKRLGHGFASGRYAVKRRLGAGGQKIVYLVRDTALERDCALSQLLPDAVDPERLRRFGLEARTLARFGAHANIVTIYDIGDQDGHPYVVCEYLEGGDLRSALSRASLPVERALEIARDVCRALDVAHQRGVVHRDVTPGNIWLLGDGTAKLGDFGLAQVAATGESRRTHPSRVLGTAAYLSPEQARGNEVDERTDLYALGCVLHEMLAGAPPFSGASSLEVVAQHVHAEPPPLVSVNPDIDPALSELVARMLAKSPARRPQRARDVLADLERMLAGAATGAEGPPLPANEPERVAAVHAAGILDTPPELAYDELVELAAQLCDTPLAYICFIDETRQWMKANVGFPPELIDAPKEIGICQTTICQSDVLVAADMSLDARFRDLPPVAQPPHLRFYAGAPLITARGHALGTICVLDVAPREISFDQVEGLRRLARQVVTRLELGEVAAELARVRGELEQTRAAEEAERRRAAPRYHDAITIGVAALPDLDDDAKTLQPADLFAELDRFAAVADGALRGRGLERLWGDAGVVRFAAGLDPSVRRHPLDACLAALALRDATRAWRPRIAVHAGATMAGAIGRWRPQFDVVGPAARLADRMAAAAEPGQIVISEPVLRPIASLFEHRRAGHIEIDGRPLELFVLERIRPGLSAGGDGRAPGAAFEALADRRFGVR